MIFKNSSNKKLALIGNISTVILLLLVVFLAINFTILYKTENLNIFTQSNSDIKYDLFKYNVILQKQSNLFQNNKFIVITRDPGGNAGYFININSDVDKISSVDWTEDSVKIVLTDSYILTVPKKLFFGGR